MSEHAELFGRAARVARDPDNFSKIDLPAEEQQALQYEKDHKWHGPTMLWYAISLCAIGAATQGWDQTGSNGVGSSRRMHQVLRAHTNVTGQSVLSRRIWPQKSGS